MRQCFLCRIIDYDYHHYLFYCCLFRAATLALTLACLLYLEPRRCRAEIDAGHAVMPMMLRCCQIIDIIDADADAAFAMLDCALHAAAMIH